MPVTTKLYQAISSRETHNRCPCLVAHASEDIVFDSFDEIFCVFFLMDTYYGSNKDDFDKNCRNWNINSSIFLMRNR